MTDATLYGEYYASPYWHDDQSTRCTHKLVPKRMDLERAYRDEVRVEQVTTLMVKNLPNRFTQATLLHEIALMGFADKYDFFYLPMDLMNGCNVGYCFINFECAIDCAVFASIMQGYRFQTFKSRKMGSCVPAHIQGLESNVRHFAKTRVMGWEQFKPFIKGHIGQALFGTEEENTFYNKGSKEGVLFKFPTEVSEEPHRELNDQELANLANLLQQCMDLCTETTC